MSSKISWVSSFQWAARLVNRAEDAVESVSEAASGVPGGLGSRTIESLKNKSVAAAHPLLDIVYHLIRNLREKISENQEINRADRREIARCLGLFLSGAHIKHQDAPPVRALQTLLSEETLLTADHLLCIEQAFTPIKNLRDSKTGYWIKVIELLQEHQIIETAGLTVNGTLDNLLQTLNDKIVGSPDPIVDRAYRLLNELQDAKKVSPEKRSEIAACLESLIQKKWIENDQPLKHLGALLLTPNPLDPLMVTEALSLIKKLCESQSGLIERVTAVTMEKIRQALGNPGLRTDSSIKEELKLLMISRVTPPNGVKEAPKDRPAAIQKQFSLLKTRASKMILCEIILRRFCKSSESDELIKQLIKETTPESPGKRIEPFKESLFRHIDNAPIGEVRKFFAKRCYSLLDPVIFYYINNFIENIHRDVQNWITQDPIRRLESIREVLIIPTINYLTTVSDGYDRIRKQTEPVQKSPDEMLAAYIDQLKVDGLSSSQLFNKLTEYILKYIPHLGWAQKASGFFDEQAEKVVDFSYLESISRFSFILGKTVGFFQRLVHRTVRLFSKQIPEKSFSFDYLWFSALSQFFYAIGIVVSPVQWFVNKTVHLFLKQLIARFVFPALFNSTKKVFGDGDYNLHGINTFIREKLRELKMDLDNPKKTSATDTDFKGLSLPMEDKIWELTVNLVEVLWTQKEAITLSNLRNEHRQAVMQIVKGVGLALLSDSMKSAATKKIIPILHKLVGQNSLEEFLLLLLTTLQEQCFSPNLPKVTKQQKIADEQSMLMELKGIARTIIRNSIEEKLDPKRHIQSEVNEFFARFKRNIENIQNRVSNLTVENVQKLITDWENFFLFMDTDIDAIETETNRGTMEAICGIIKEFTTQSNTVAVSISLLKTLIAQRQHNQKILDPLQSLRKQFESLKPPYKELAITFRGIFPDRYPPKIKKMLVEFLDILQHRNKVDESLVSEKIQDLTDQLTTTVTDLLGQIEETKIELERIHINLKVDMPRLSAWTADLVPFEAQGETTTVSKILSKTVGPQASSVLTDMILSSTHQVLKFVNNEHHVKALALYSINAFLKGRKG